MAFVKTRPAPNGKIDIEQILGRIGRSDATTLPGIVSLAIGILKIEKGKLSDVSRETSRDYQLLWEYADRISGAAADRYMELKGYTVHHSHSARYITNGAGHLDSAEVAALNAAAYKNIRMPAEDFLERPHHLN
ncbi:TPA: hypothetical protein HA228_03655 [Candidatus Woesearchaeota archaeon]|nr:hypothetical protein [Candidatus Woesearchaeota archaeon]HII64391.1 hypothetical protein [Candidatus Woesearchaeota archaeon]